MSEASSGASGTPPVHGGDGDRQRLQKVLSHAGVESRRAAEEMIISGRVTVNGEPCTVLGTKVDPESDVVAVDGKPIPRHVKLVYLMLNKPSGYITSVGDPEQRPTVMDLVPRSPRIYPVGRLDAGSEGLLLMTNDGEFANHMAHPSFSLEKEYHVAVPGVVLEEDLQALRDGMMIDEKVTSPAQVRVLSADGNVTWLSMIIHEGRNRQIRRMLHQLGYRVDRLVRMRIGPLWLGSLSRGSYRSLTASEVGMLKRSSK